MTTICLFNGILDFPVSVLSLNTNPSGKKEAVKIFDSSDEHFIGCISSLIRVSISPPLQNTLACDRHATFVIS